MCSSGSGNSSVGTISLPDTNSVQEAGKTHRALEGGEPLVQRHFDPLNHVALMKHEAHQSAKTLSKSLSVSRPRFHRPGEARASVCSPASWVR